MSGKFHCRFCQVPLKNIFVDIGLSPLANAFLTEAQLGGGESFLPLTVFLCENCLLVQLPEFEKPAAIFEEYAYFSSFSKSWLEHSERYVKAMIDRFGIGKNDLVVEVASNDGYLLRFFKERGVPILGIEPSKNVAAEAVKIGIPTLVEFFGEQVAKQTAKSRGQANLLLGNNVLAHVPNINDFVAGMTALLAPNGVITVEFPHLLQLIQKNQFDTIYHEHFSYLSLHAVTKIFAAHRLEVFDVEELPTHGGSLRVYAQHTGNSERPVGERVKGLHQKEAAAGLLNPATYENFGKRVAETKWNLLELLIRLKREGRSVAAYGAAAKGNTLLNFCGIRGDLIDYVVDRNPYKQGRYLPGTRIPILAPEAVAKTRPDYLLILPWNLREEIMGEMSHVRGWGGKFITSIPQVEITP